MMAAAALTRSRGVAGVRPAKSLTVIFSLLCLVSLATGFLFDENELEKHKRNLHTAKQQLELVKEKAASISEFMQRYEELMKPLTSFMKTTSKSLPDDYPSMEGLIESINNFVEKTKIYVEGQNGKLREDIETTEKELRKYEVLIKFLEEEQAEL